jgi:cytoskeletal protein CcmA (bactofilin family)
MAEAATAQHSTIGPDIQIKGTIVFEKDVQFQGRLEGNINGTGTLHVAPGGKIVGDIDTTAVVIEGDVRGNIAASDRVELKASSHYEGDLRSTRLAIEAGAFFTGHVTVGAEPGKERAAAKSAAARPIGTNTGKAPEAQAAR